MEHRSKELFDAVPPTMTRNGPSRKVSRAGFWGGLLLVVLVGLTVFGITVAIGPLLPQRVTAHSPSVAQVRRVALVQRTLPLVGTLELTDQGFLTAPETGTVSSVSIRTGVVVPKGQVLVVLDSRELRDEVKTLTTQRDTLEGRVRLLEREQDLMETKSIIEKSVRDSNLARKESEVAEQRELLAQGLVRLRDLKESQWSLDQTRSQTGEAQADEALARVQAEADLDQTRRELVGVRDRVRALVARLDACVVRSPQELLVLSAEETRVRPGAAVSRYQTLVAYALLTRAEVRFHVPGYAAGSLAVGDFLTVSISGQPYRARVTHKSQVSTDNTADTEVAALLETLPSPLVSGQSVETTLPLGQAKNQLVLPTGPWVASGRLEWVYKLSPDGTMATRTKVRVSTDYDQTIVVLEGLAENDRIITDAYEEFGSAETISSEDHHH